MELTELYDQRMPLDAGIRIRVGAAGEMLPVEKGYKIVIPSSQGKKPFVANENARSTIREERFMFKIGSSRINGEERVIYESDIIDYTVCGKKGLGVVVYEPKIFAYAVKDVNTQKSIILSLVEINEILGDIYSTPELLKPTKDVYNACENCGNVPAECNERPDGKSAPIIESAPAPQVSAVDIYVDVTMRQDNTATWAYKIMLNGKVRKEDSKPFSKISDKAYYTAASLILALEQLSVARPIRLHTAIDGAASLFGENKYLDRCEKAGWVKSDGSKIRHADLLRELKSNVDRLGGQIEVITQEAA